MAQPDFWQDQTAAQAVVKEKAGVEKHTRQWEALRRRMDDLGALLQLADEDPSLQSELKIGRASCRERV